MTVPMRIQPIMALDGSVEAKPTMHAMRPQDRAIGAQSGNNPIGGPTPEEIEATKKRLRDDGKGIETQCIEWDQKFAHTIDIKLNLLGKESCAGFRAGRGGGLPIVICLACARRPLRSIQKVTCRHLMLSPDFQNLISPQKKCSAPPMRCFPSSLSRLAPIAPLLHRVCIE